MPKITIIGGCERSGTSLLRALFSADAEYLVYPWDLDLYYWERLMQNALVAKHSLRRLKAEIIMSEKFNIQVDELNFKEYLLRELDLINGYESFLSFLVGAYCKFIGTYPKHFVLKCPGAENWLHLYAVKKIHRFIYIWRKRSDVFKSMYHYEGTLWRHKCHRNKLRKNRLRSINSFKKLQHSKFDLIFVSYQKFIANKDYKLNLIKNLDLTPVGPAKLHGWTGSNSSMKKQLASERENKLFLAYANDTQPNAIVKLLFSVKILPYVILHLFRLMKLRLKILVFSLKVTS